MSISSTRSSIALLSTLSVACGDNTGVQSTLSTSGTSSESSSSGGTSNGGTSGGATTSQDTASPTSGENSTDGIKLDIGSDKPPPLDICKVQDQDGVGICSDKVPTDTFEPVVEWEWWGQGDYTQSSVTPLVANFTDDNTDGEVDLCDNPDILVVAGGFSDEARLFLLDGATGTVHFEFEGLVDPASTPALGDIDGDGLVEVVTSLPQGNLLGYRAVAFEHTGAIKWISSAAAVDQDGWGSTTAIGDVDNDGRVEIAIANLLLDADGELMITFPLPEIVPSGSSYAMPVLADLDGDDDLEILFGRVAYHHDGSVHYLVPEIQRSGFSHVADLDGDGAPEVLVTTQTGISLLKPDGAVVYANLRPNGVDVQNTNWVHPAAIHDLAGNGSRQFAMGSYNLNCAYSHDANILWTSDTGKSSRAAGTSAFDFLGDGTAEVIYMDDTSLRIFDGVDGDVLTDTPQSPWGFFRYPSVADVDNDGSAEILVVGSTSDPTLRVFGDAMNGWVSARRIWNQHSYHVTNVREDGTIPHVQKPNWQGLNTFRAQAQLADDGGACLPPP